MLTLGLTENWDLEIKGGGFHVLQDAAYTAQTVANEQRTFAGEPFFNVQKGIPYFRDTHGHMPPDSLVKAHLQRAALRVANVASARVTLTKFSGRKLEGYTSITTTDGETINGNF